MSEMSEKEQLVLDMAQILGYGRRAAEASERTARNTAVLKWIAIMTVVLAVIAGAATGITIAVHQSSLSNVCVSQGGTLAGC